MSRLQGMTTSTGVPFDQLSGYGDLDALRDRHAAFFLDLAQRAQADIRGPRRRVWLDILDDEIDNFRAALAWTVERDDGRALALAAALGPLWRNRSHASEGRSWLRRASAATAAVAPPGVLAGALVVASDLAREQGDEPDAVEKANEARSAAASAGDDAVAADAARALGSALLKRGQFIEARDAFRDAAARGGSAPVAAATARRGIAWCEFYLGDAEGVQRAISDAREFARSTGDDVLLAEHLLDEGSLRSELEDYAGASGCFKEAAALRQAQDGCDAEVAVLLRRWAAVRELVGERDDAEKLYVEAERSARASGERSLVAGVVRDRARKALLERRHDEATTFFGEAAALVRAVPDPTSDELRLWREVVSSQAMVALDSGNADLGLHWLEEAVAIATRLGGWALLEAQQQIASQLLQLGNEARAVEVFDEMLASRELQADDPHATALRLQVQMRRCIATHDISGAVDAGEQRVAAAQRVGIPQTEASAWADLAVARSANGDHEGATDAADRALDLSERSNVWILTFVRRYAARVYAAALDGETAARHAVASLVGRADRGEVTLPVVLEAAAMCDLLAGRPEDAARVMGASSAIRARTRWEPSSVMRSLIDLINATGEEALGPAAWARLVEAGRSISSQDAVAGIVERLAPATFSDEAP